MLTEQRDELLEELERAQAQSAGMSCNLREQHDLVGRLRRQLAELQEQVCVSVQLFLFPGIFQTNRSWNPMDGIFATEPHSAAFGPKTVRNRFQNDLKKRKKIFICCFSLFD